MQGCQRKRLEEARAWSTCCPGTSCQGFAEAVFTVGYAWLHAPAAILGTKPFRVEP